MTQHLRALQAAMVRLSVDPAWRDAVYRGPVAGLDEADRALLVGVDPRAWGVDTHRRARLLQAALEEAPVTGAVLGVPAADAFFSSPAFHRVLTDRGSLTLAFCAWARKAGPGTADLEGALALARRPTSPGPGQLVLAPGVAAVVAPSGTLHHLQAAREALGPDPIAALAGGQRVAALRPRGGEEHLLITPDGRGGADVTPSRRALVALLAAVSRPRPRAEVIAEARRHGAGRDAAGVVDGLLADGLLVAG